MLSTIQLAGPILLISLVCGLIPSFFFAVLMELERKSKRWVLFLGFTITFGILAAFPQILHGGWRSWWTWLVTGGVVGTAQIWWITDVKPLPKSMHNSSLLTWSVGQGILLGALLGIIAIIFY